jgi:hypothetical protein
MVLNNLRFNQNLSEFDIQVFIYNKLVARGIPVRGNVPIKIDGRWKYLDLVIFDKFLIAVCILEVKKNKVNCEKQLNTYEKSGVKVIPIYGMEQAKKFVRYVHKSNDISFIDSKSLMPNEEGGFPDTDNFYYKLIKQEKLLEGDKERDNECRQVKELLKLYYYPERAQRLKL